MKYQFFFGLLFVSIALVGVAAPGKAPNPAATASGQSGTALIEVYPTGSYPGDLQSVQAALDNVASPGTVVMKSTDQSGKHLAFNFGGDPAKTGTGGVIKLLRPDITLTGDGWDETLKEPKTKITGGGGPYTFSPTLSGTAMVFAINAPGVTMRQLKLTTTSALTGVYISSAKWQPNDHPVVVERNDFSVVNNSVLAYYSAAFPVKIDNNLFKGYGGAAGWWLGFTLQPIEAYPYDVPIEPKDSLGNIVRYPLEITNNRMITTPGVFAQAMLIYGWANNYSTDPDPDKGFRRYRPNANYPWTYQFVHGDNGPVLISGNDIQMDSPPSTGAEAICLGGTNVGLNHSLVRGNTISGRCGTTIAVALYGHDNVLVDNDLSEAQAYCHASITMADTTFSNNVLGKLIPLPSGSEMPLGIPQPALELHSTHYYPDRTPTPNAVEYCVIMKNDYRLTGCKKGAILVSSNKELSWRKTMLTCGVSPMGGLSFHPIQPISVS